MAVAQRGFERRSHVIRFGVLLPVLLHTSMALQVHLNALPSTHMGSLGPKSFLQLSARLREGSAGLTVSRASLAFFYSFQKKQEEQDAVEHFQFLMTQTHTFIYYLQLCYIYCIFSLLFCFYIPFLSLIIFLHFDSLTSNNKNIKMCVVTCHLEDTIFWGLQVTCVL